jgi:arylsulfatase A-like enzyme
MLRRALDLGDTALIVLSDHGETLGERYHALDHGGQVFDEQIRIPFLVHSPGLAPRRVDELVQTVDLLPTVLELLGITAPDAQVIQGRSLVPLLVGGDAPTAPRPAFSAARAVAARHGDRGYELDGSRRIQSVRSLDWKLIRYPGVRDDYLELYDLRVDPNEKHNLAASAPQRLAEYTALLEAWSSGDAAGKVDLDPALREQLRELGYLE